MNFTITSHQIVWICGFIASVWGVVKIIKELKKPSDDLKATSSNTESEGVSST